MQSSNLSDPLSCLIHSRFERIASQFPDRIAIFFDDCAISYRELNLRADRLSQKILAAATTPAPTIGILLHRSPELVVALLAVLKAGGCYLPLDPNYPPDRLNFMLTDSGAQLLIASTDTAELLNSHSAQLVVISPDSEKSAAPQKGPPHPAHGDGRSLAYLLYTSGSTGRPKGVQIEHSAVTNFLDAISDTLAVNSEDVFLACTTICFDIAVLEIFVPLCTGAQLVISPYPIGENPKAILNLLDKYQVTKMQATPSGWRMLLAAGLTEKPHLDILCGGESLGASLAQMLLSKGRSLWNLYGPTESTVRASVCQIKSNTLPITIGHPLPNISFHLLDPNGNPTDNEQGEIGIAGAGLARGYLNRPELNAEKFIFVSAIKQRLYRTGDLARRLPDGSFEFLGRIDNQVKLRGYRIELGEIETTLEKHPLVQEACAVIRGNSEDDKRLIAYVATGSSSPCNESSGISSWQTIWDNTYIESNRATDPRFNISGWNDSYTGLPLPAEHVREWVETTVQRLIDLKPQRVLEIGCGTGLLLFRIANLTSHYHATDISAQAIKYIERHLGDLSPKVSLSALPAHDIPDAAFRNVDLVIINSVLQYFPSPAYLVQLLSRLSAALPEGARIFLGDIRNLDLLESFHLSVQLEQSPDSLPTDQLRSRISRRMALEQGLLLSPRFFCGLTQHIPRLALSHLMLKRGRFQNELTRFRFDAIIRVGAAVEPTFIDEKVEWGTEVRDLAALDALLARPSRPPLHIFGIPNARLLRESVAQRILRSTGCPDTVGALRDALATYSEREAVEPETVQVLAKGHECHCQLFWNSEQPECFDALIFPKESSLEYAFPSTYRGQELLPLEAYANTPAHPLKERQLISEMRTILSANLPEYMIPSSIVVLKRLPHTPSGKIDRNNLPDPPSARPPVEQAFVAARNPTEAWITSTWQSLLGVDSVGVLDNFFESGGDSLLIVELISRVERHFNVVLGLGSVFEDPSVAAIAELVEHISRGTSVMRRGTSRDELVADTVLPDSFWVKPKLPLASWDQPSSIFLTGATGFLGAYLLRELVVRTKARIECLVRARSTNDGLRRIKAALVSYGLWEDEFLPRISPRVGDLSQPKLGLQSHEYAELASTIDVIIHNGATVNLLFPYSVLRAPNVQGTREILDLSVAERLKRIHYISSLAALESPEFLAAQEIDEESRALYPELLSGGYAQSKWVGEELMREAFRRGVPCSISRPGSIAQEPGNIVVDDLPLRLIKAFHQMGSIPRGEWKLDLSDVHAVANAIVTMSLNASIDGHTAHLVTTEKVGFSDITKAFSKLGRPLQELDLQAWRESLMEICQRHKDFPLSPLLSMFTEIDDRGRSYFENSSIHLNCSTKMSESLLTVHGATLPRPASHILNGYVEEILKRNVANIPRLNGIC